MLNLSKKEKNRNIRNNYKKAACLIVAIILMGGFFISCGKTNIEIETIPSSLKSIAREEENPYETAGEYQSSSEIEQKEQKTIQSKSPEKNNNISFTEKTMFVNGRENKVFILSIDITEQGSKVLPYLSFNRIYGFQTLSEMAKDTGAYAAVNGGFFFEFGRPSGLVVVNGEIISPGTGKYESIIWDKSGARFEKINTLLKIKTNEMEFKVDRYNEPYDEKEIAMFSPAYGKSDRKTHERRIISVENNIIEKAYVTDQPASIPENGYIVCFPIETEGILTLKGKTIERKFNHDFGKDVMAYECASMLVKDGQSLAGDIMPWVGNLNQYDPRTCVGITNDGRLGFVVIDGRQLDYSSGTTGRETADLMIELGFKDVAMLDGGASSEIIIDGEIVNRPSGQGIERIIAGAFLIF